MSYSDQDIERVRNISIAAQLGYNTGRRVMICCPMAGHNDSTPSFIINIDNSFKCFGCEAKGRNFLDFAQQFQLRAGGATDEKDAFKQVMKEYSNGDI